MTPEEVGERLVALLAADDADAGDGAAGVSGGGPATRAPSWTCRPPAGGTAVRAARDRRRAGLRLLRLALRRRRAGRRASRSSPTCGPRSRRHGVLLRTRVPRDAPGRRRRSSTSSPAPPGTSGRRYEMFGIDFAGHPDLRAAAAAARVRGPPAAQGVRAGLPGGQGRGRARRSRASPRRAASGADAPARRPDPGEWGPRRTLAGEGRRARERPERRPGAGRERRRDREADREPTERREALMPLWLELPSGWSPWSSRSSPCR